MFTALLCWAILGCLGVQGNNRDQVCSFRPLGWARDPLLPLLLLAGSPNLSVSPNLGIFLAAKKDYQSLAPGGRGGAGDKAKGASRCSWAGRWGRLQGAGVGVWGDVWVCGVTGMKAPAGQVGPASC